MYQQDSQQLAEQTAVRCVIRPLDLETKTPEDAPPDDPPRRAVLIQPAVLIQKT